MRDDTGLDADVGIAVAYSGHRFEQCSDQRPVRDVGNDGLRQRCVGEVRAAHPERQVGDPEARYKIAQVYARLGDKESAVRILQLSVENGFFSYPYFTQDPLLDSLRNEPKFADLMQMAQRRHEALKSNFF